MKFLVVIVTLCVAHGIHGQGLIGSLVGGATNVIGNILGGGRNDPCSRNVIEDYREAQSHFFKTLYAKVAARSDNHFVFSPITIWLSLSALAEGAEPIVQSQVLTSLSLPQEKCIRNKFYEIALRVEESGRDVSFERRRCLVIDEFLEVNPTWSKYVTNYGLLAVVAAPIKSSPEATSERLKKFLETRFDINFKGNSILIDRLDYEGLWSTAFDDSNTYKAPFYNDLGVQIGTVDMMKAKKYVRVAHVPFMHTKVLELPVGFKGRYTMLIVVGTGNNILKNAFELFLGSIFKVLSLLQMSLVPVEIEVPKFTMSSEFDVRIALEEMGIDGFWNDPAATGYVSKPAALPGNFIQHTSVKIDSGGVDPVSPSKGGLLPGLVDLAANTASDVASAVGHNFVANRPFMYALLETKTQTCIFAGAFARPTVR
ncbi:unnamed protein product [Arctia plantaginis]|uniref:Serpin domain-containing protein n=1 Tax=Arctia plantaginis TaxID=874455 RepID=A0A8S0Z129_ARCPL|nr:unnamed protein product [Arctia plantaginis]